MFSYHIACNIEICVIGEKLHHSPIPGWDVLLLSTSNSYPKFRDRKSYGTTVAPSPLQYGVLTQVFVSLFRMFHWKTFSIIKDETGAGPFHATWSQVATARFRQESFSVFSVNIGWRHSITSEEMVTSALRQVAVHSRGNQNGTSQIVQILCNPTLFISCGTSDERQQHPEISGKSSPDEQYKACRF